MFDHNCTVCEKRQLIFPSQVTTVANTDRGIELTFVCWCGAEQQLVTGKKTGTARKVTLAA